MKRYLAVIATLCIVAVFAAYFASTIQSVDTSDSGTKDRTGVEARYGADVTKTKAYFFYSNYCPHCEAVKSLVDRVAEKLHLTYCCVDSELSGECSVVAESAGVYAVPTLVVIEGENRKILVGESELRDFLDSLI